MGSDWDPSNHYSVRCCRGFTLLEILLVVFLIGLATGLVAINIDRDADDIAKLESERFAALLNHLKDESTLVGLPMGIEVAVGENRYRFWELEEAWRRVDDVDVLRERVVPDTVTLDLSLLQSTDLESSDEDPETTGPPRPPGNMILVEPTGIVQPFIARFDGDELSYNISLDNAFSPVVGRSAK